jgi:DNA-binding MarR family transcriptional regulator
VAHHLVTRVPSSADRRKVILTLTGEGQSILEKARNGTQARLKDILANLTPEDRDAVHHAMQLLQTLFSPVMTTQSVSKR